MSSSALYLARAQAVTAGIADARRVKPTDVAQPPPAVDAVRYRFWHLERAPAAQGALAGMDEQTRRQHSRVGLGLVLVNAARDAEAFPVQRAVAPASSSSWLTWVGTCAGLVFGKYVTSIELEAGFRPIAPDVVQRLGGLREMAYAASLTMPGPVGDHANIAHLQPLNDELTWLGAALNMPRQATVEDSELNDFLLSSMSLQRACYFGLVLYMAGKRITTSHRSVAVARARNMEQKFNNSGAWPDITGTMKMSDEAHLWISNVWETDTRFRVGFVTPLLSYLHHPGGEYEAPIVLILQMLVHSQMSHVGIITDFVGLHPYVFSLPSIQGEVITMVVDAEALKKLPAVERQFGKLLYRDGFKYFDGKALARLTALAKEVLVASRPSLADYVTDPVDPALLQEFRVREALELANQPAAPPQGGPVPPPVLP